MTTGWPDAGPRHAAATAASPPGSGTLPAPRTLGALLSVTIASVVFAVWNLQGGLGRDSAIYLYGGQRLTHGVPPYASIMDPKGPMPGILCGFGVAVARLIGRSDLLVVRVEFCALSVLGVLGVYLLVLELWHSVVAGVVAAAVMASFTMYAADSLRLAPDGHTPGIVFFVFTMWFAVRRQWYWAGVLASLAVFSWQPLFPYALVVVLCAAVWSRGSRLRATAWAIAGLATPLVVLLGFYAAAGYPGKLVEGWLQFPLEGGYRPPITFAARVRWIFTNIPDSFGLTSILLAVGLALLLALAVWTIAAAGRSWRTAVCSPIVLLVLLSFLAQVGYVFVDYIGWTHALPLLPYAAVGFGGATAALLRHVPRPRAVGVGSLLAVGALATACAVAYYQPTDSTLLRQQQAGSCAIKRSLVPGTAVWSIDNPIPLAQVHAVNPDNYAFVGGGLAEWKIARDAGGFDAWMHEIESESSIVVFQGWRQDYDAKPRMEAWFVDHGWEFGWIGQWSVYVTPRALHRMTRLSIRLTAHQQEWPLLSDGGTYRDSTCAPSAG